MEASAIVGKVTATQRKTTGKGEARKLRSQGLIPAVCYGRETGSVLLAVDPKVLIAALDPEKLRNTLIDLTIEGAGQARQIQVMLKDVQLDCIKKTVLHVDFLQVSIDSEVNVEVPLLLEGRAEGVKLGGTLHQVFRTLPVACIPDQIPGSIQMDVSSMNMGDALHIKDLVLPEGVRVLMPSSQTVAQVITPRKTEEAAEKPEGEEVPAEPAAATEEKPPAA